MKYILIIGIIFMLPLYLLWYYSEVCCYLIYKRNKVVMILEALLFSPILVFKYSCLLLIFLAIIICGIFIPRSKKRSLNEIRFIQYLRINKNIRKVLKGLPVNYYSVKESTFLWQFILEMLKLGYRPKLITDELMNRYSISDNNTMDLTEFLIQLEDKFNVCYD